MKKIKNDLFQGGYNYILDEGDTSAVEVNGKYGIIQYVGIIQSCEGRYSYGLSKVFTDLISYMPNTDELKNILQSNKFYYIRAGLSSFDYMGEIQSIKVTYLGINPVYGDKQKPRYWRSYDVNPYTGKSCWYLHDIETYGCKKVKVCDDKFKKLSPYWNWGMSVILTNWKDHFTLDTWDDEFLRKNLEGVYERCPELRPRKVEYETVKNAYPSHKWVKETPLKEEKDEPIRKGYQAILEALKEYITAIDALEKKTAGELRKLTKKTVKKLNEIDKEYECIETVEREDLWEYFVNVLWSLKKPTVIDVIDEVREW